MAKFSLLKRLTLTNSEKSPQTPTAPPGWQSATQPANERDRLVVPFCRLLHDDVILCDAAREMARRLHDRIRVLPGALSGEWSTQEGGVQRITQVCAALHDERAFMALPPAWRLAVVIVACSRALWVIHGLQVEYQDGHLWDPLAGPLTRPWRWRFAEPRYPDSNWQDAFWLTRDIFHDSLINPLMVEDGLYAQLFAALTLQDESHNLLCQLAVCAEKTARNEPTNWPDTSDYHAVDHGEFTRTTLSPHALYLSQQARFERLDRESGMAADIRQIWNTTPLLKFLELAQELPAAPHGAYSNSGGLGTFVCDALQAAVRVRKSCALPPDEPEEQMRQGEGWNTAVWFIVLQMSLQRLCHLRVMYRSGMAWTTWRPEEGPMPVGVVYRARFERCPNARHRAMRLLETLMPSGLLSWFRPFPLLFRTFSGAIAGHASGALLDRIVDNAIQKSSEQWLRDRGLPVTPDAGTLSFLPPTAPAQRLKPANPLTAIPAPMVSTPPATAIPGTPAQEAMVPHQNEADLTRAISTILPAAAGEQAAPAASPLDTMLNLLSTPGDTQTMHPPVSSPVSPSARLMPEESEKPAEENGLTNDTAVDTATAFIAWLRDGIAEGALAVNTPDALIHVWTLNFVFMECPAIIQKWTMTRTQDASQQEHLWRAILKQLRMARFFHEPDGSLTKGRIYTPGKEKKPFREVKGHLVQSIRILKKTAIPPTSEYLKLKGK